VTEGHGTRRTRVFSLTYALDLIVEGLTVCSSVEVFFVQFTILLLQGFEATHPIFDVVTRHECG